MKLLILSTLLAITLNNASAIVKLSDNGVKSGNKQDFKTLAEVDTADKPVCLYIKRTYVPINTKAVELAGGKTCRNIGRVGVDYIGINSSTRNAHLYEEAVKAVN